MLKCEFCNNTYKTKSSLNHHKKNAKKCLILRGEEIVNNYVCEYCDFKSITKDTLNKHQLCCKMKNKKYTTLEMKDKLSILKKYYEIKLEQKDILLERIEKELKECKDNFNMIASKPTIVNTTNNHNNTRINNLIIADLNESTIIDKVESNFTLEYLNDGIRGLAKFTKDHIVNPEDGKPKYICSDPSRAVFKYKDENGVVQKDVSATKLKNAIKDPIIKKSKTLFINENSRLFDGIANADDDNENNELMNDQITTLKDNFLKVKNIDENQVDYAKEMVLVMSDYKE